MAYVRGESDIFEYLRGELSRRIMIIDGAMGTMIQVGRGLVPLCLLLVPTL